jgi:glutamate-1-semialdehyde 2,1-aminomutase
LETWKESYVKRTPNSTSLFDRANKVLPGGVSYAIRDLDPYPFYVDHASGSSLYDVDGNVYTDYWMGHGALLLGHTPKRVVDAAKRQIEQGTHFGYPHTLEVKLAELVAETVPSADEVRFANSGTEANMYAVRLARAFTGRMKIAKIEGGWHGGYDALHKAVHAPFTAPESAGLNPKALEDTLVLPFNDLDAARNVARSEDLAAILLEPVLGAAGIIPPEPGFLAGLRELCDGSETLLIFDEVITGFRLALGGAQDLFGVTPDITILGKILGGGFPIGGLCGRRDILEHIDQRKYPDSSARSFQGGTFVGNPMSMVAGIETLNELKEGDIYNHVNRLGERIRAGLEDIFERSNIDVAITGVASLFAIHFQKKKPKNAREAAKDNVKLANALHMYMLSKNIAYLTPSLPHMFLSNAHTDRDVEDFLFAAEKFVKDISP